MTSEPGNTISVIIPVFNGERYIAAAIESVLQQTRPADEIIVVNDGSSDATAAVLAAYDRRIAVISQENHGGAHATNQGISVASGSFLSFLDADDLWTSRKLEIQVDWLSRHPHAEAVFGYVQQFISADLDPEQARRLKCPHSPQAGLTKNTILIRRPSFDRIGAFDSNLRSIDFLDWFTRALDAKLKFEMLPDLLALRRLHNANNGRLVRDSQMTENLIALKRALDRRREQTRHSVSNQ